MYPLVNPAPPLLDHYTQPVNLFNLILILIRLFNQLIKAVIYWPRTIEGSMHILAEIIALRMALGLILK